MRLRGMLATIDFDDQLLLHRDEVDHTASERLLPAEFDTIKMSIAQPPPKQFLRFG